MRNTWVALSMISRSHARGARFFHISYGGYQSATLRDVVVAASDGLMPTEWKRRR